MSDPLVIAGKEFGSRLMLGTGRHRSMEEMVASIEAAGAEIVTVAIGRLNLDDPTEKSILDYFDWDRYTVLPNTAGCRTADEAVFTAHLARELTGSSWLKLEVIPEPKYLLPDPIATLEAARILVKEGFVVLPYINADPVLARRLEEVGVAGVVVRDPVHREHIPQPFVLRRMELLAFVIGRYGQDLDTVEVDHVARPHQMVGVFELVPH